MFNVTMSVAWIFYFFVGPPTVEPGDNYYVGPADIQWG